MDTYEKIQDAKTEHKIYKKAHEAFKPMPFSKRKKPTYFVAFAYSNFYHLVSLCASLIAVYFAVQIMVGGQTGLVYWLLSFLFYTILLGVSFGIEVLRKHYYTSAAKERQKAQIKGGTFAGVAIVFLFSAAISGFGGYALQNNISDNTSFIQGTYSHESDSIGKLHAPMIEALKTQIQSTTAAQKKARAQYQKIEHGEKLETLEQSLSEREDAYKEAIAGIKSSEKKEITQSSKESSNLALIAMCLILVLELFAIFSYFGVYWYLWGCKNENDALQIVATNKEPVHAKTYQETTQKNLQPVETSSISTNIAAQVQPVETNMQEDVQQDEIKENPLKIGFSISERQRYYLTKYPKLYKKLVNEFRSAELQKKHAKVLAKENQISVSTVLRVLATIR